MSQGNPVRGPIRLLYIDDDEGLGLLVKKAMARRGHDVVNATSGEAGIERLRRGDIDVIALDHTMPGETGLDVMARLGDRSGRPPVVYVTGSGDARIAVDALKSGADDYVIKEISPEFYELLIAAVEQALDRSRLRFLKEENERLVREARDRAELMLREVNHRIANSLGLVAAMVRMQAAELADPAAVKALRETQARIIAIAGVHRRLYTSERVGVVEIDNYLEHLLDELGTSLGGGNHAQRIRLLATPLLLSTDKAVSLGIIVSELVTNAFKYAYVPGTGGEIRVRISAPGPDGRAEIAVEDDGAGFDAQQPTLGTGLGGRIVDAMAVNLHAEIDRGSSAAGTRVSIRFTPD